MFSLNLLLSSFSNLFKKSIFLILECEEYSKAVYTQQESPVLLPVPGQNTVSECGIVEVPLIIGGVKAQVKEFPHMVRNYYCFY